MSSQKAQSKLHRRHASSSDLSRLTGSASDRSSRSLTEVITTEPAIKRALAPLVQQALSSGVAVVCEVLPGVGRYVLGSRRQLTDLIGLATAQGVAACHEGVILVRIARQQSGFAATDTLLVSVSLHGDGTVQDITYVEAAMPLAEGEESGDTIVLAGTRVLLVAPNAHDARIQSHAAKRFGACVESALVGADAQELLRAAYGEGKRFDVMYVDCAVPGAAALLLAARDDASLGTPFRLVATSSSEAAAWCERGAESTLSKPVLPLELCDALRDANHVDVNAMAVDSLAEAITCVPPGHRRRASGVRSLHLAAALAAVAVGPGRSGP